MPIQEDIIFISNDYQSTQDCIICYHPIQNQPIHSLETSEDTNDAILKSIFYYNIKNQNCSCLYEVDFKCLIKWLMTSPVCPMCRTLIDVNSNTSSITIVPQNGSIVLISDRDHRELLLDLTHYDHIDTEDAIDPINIPVPDENEIVVIHHPNRFTQVIVNALIAFIIMIVLIIYIYTQ